MDGSLNDVQVRRDEDPKRAAALSERMDRLSGALDALEKHLARLESRLTPVLGPEAPHPLTGELNEDPASPLAGFLAASATRLQSLADYTGGLTSRVDL